MDVNWEGWRAWRAFSPPIPLAIAGASAHTLAVFLATAAFALAQRPRGHIKRTANCVGAAPQLIESVSVRT